MGHRFREVDISAVLSRPGQFNPEAIDYGAATRPLTPVERRLLCFHAEVELSVAEGYQFDIAAYRNGIPPGVVEAFMHERWIPEETQHGIGLMRRLAADAEQYGTEGRADLVWDSEPDRSAAERRRERSLLTLKRFAIAKGLKAAHQTPFDETLTSLVDAFHMTIGGITEVMAARSYGLLADYTDDPVIRQMVPLLRADEHKHEEFYFGRAFQVMEGRSFVQATVRALLPRAFQPVGVGLGYHELASFGFVAHEFRPLKRAGRIAEDVDELLQELLGNPSLRLAAASVERAIYNYRSTLTAPLAERPGHIIPILG